MSSKLLLAGGALAVAIIAPIAIGFVRMPSAAPVVETEAFASPGKAVAARAAENLSKAIRIKTISYGDERDSKQAFEAFHAFLAETYPLTHQKMERTLIAGQSMIFRWPGADAGAQPVGFAAHIDVVPAEEANLADWERPPFSGAIEDGIIWGRGALDDKGSLIALMEAAERLSASGFAPQRDVYFLFGHDEEIGGRQGAAAITAHLRDQGVQFAWVLDEGSAPVRRIVPGYDGVAALISVAEKGYMNAVLTARADGGHSSTPGPDTAATILSRAIVRLADAPFEPEIDDTLEVFLHGLAPHTPFAQRFVLSNLWLTGGVVKDTLVASPVTAATMRTTTAVTMIDGGVKANILPKTATALVNLRLHPRDKPEDVQARIKEIIDDVRIEVRFEETSAASEVSAIDGPGYLAVADVARAIYGDVLVAPSLTVGGTDQRHYGRISDAAYRFFPFLLEPEDLGRMHGVNERIEIDNLARGVMFYEDMIGRQGELSAFCDA